MNELWKDIPNWEGYYQVSNLGNFRSLDRIVKRGTGTQTIHGRTIIPKRIKFNPYLGVYLRKQGTYTIMNIHKLVALTFLEKGNNECVNHLNGNKLDNKLENLEWTTFSQNQKHAIHITKVKKVKTSTEVWKATTTYQYDLWGDLINIYPTLQEAAKVSGVHRATIGDCCRGRIKTGGSYVWSYTPVDKNHFKNLHTIYESYLINGGRCPVFIKNNN